MMEFGFLNPIARFVLDRLIGWLRRLDYVAAQRVDFFIANSENTRERIQKYYDRESEVIYPGVFLTPNPSPEREWNSGNPPSLKEKGLGDEAYYLGLGRCIPYKRFDLLVDAFNQN